MSIFFVRIIPYRRRHLLLCGICSRGVVLKGKRQVEAAKRLNEATLSLIDERLSLADYEGVLAQVRVELETALESFAA